jgi:lysophospholipase L1-like esterase
MLTFLTETINVVAPILPAISFLPFAPVVLADFLPRDTPASYIRAAKKSSPSTRQSGEKPAVLVCAGDSLTHGSVSANWVNRVAFRLLGGAGPDKKHTVLNAGVNSETVAALRNRIEDIIAARPTFLTILIGTNDLIGSLDSSAARMYILKLPGRQKTFPSLESYTVELRALVQELDDRLPPDSKIAVLSPPPLGECIDGQAWRRGEEMATLCLQACHDASDRVFYLPLFEEVREEMIEFLTDRQGREFDFGVALPLTSMTVPWQLLVQRKSFEDARRINEFGYTIDSVHFGDEFGEIVENMVCGWMTRF